LVITRGKNGLVYYDFKNHKFYYCPSFSNNVTDKVGTGDNMLAAMALFFRLDAPTYVSLLFGSAAAYSAIQSYANSEVLDKNKLIKFLEYSLK
jgi:sugar/nucleoside kinase (ribokinase family)